MRRASTPYRPDNLDLQDVHLTDTMITSVRSVGTVRPCRERGAAMLRYLATVRVRQVTGKS